ncbi:MAG: class I tRNA ligase family protein, partial [Mariprofundaceae bacterium]
EVDTAMVEYRFNEAAGALYNFIWGTYCDWYVEAAKVFLYGDDEAAKTETRIVMLTALEGWLKLLHPICPDITETLWQELHGPGARLVTGSWHDPREDHDAGAVRRIRKVIDVVSAIRSVRGEMNVNPGKRIEAEIACAADVRSDLDSHDKLMKSLARLESINWLDAAAVVESAAVAPLADATVYLPLAGLVNVEEEVARLEKNIAKLDKDIAMRKGKLGNARFVDNAPEAVVAKVTDELEALKTKHAEMTAGLESLNKL